MPTTKLAFAFLPALLLPLAGAHAHAVAGDRVFPATLAVDDPGVSDELTLPEVGHFKDSDGSATTTSFEYTKTLTKDLGLSLEGAWIDNDDSKGFDNFGLGAKYVFYTDAPHELMLSTGLDWDIGGSGSRHVAERFSTITPAVFVGKGLGDLPDSMAYLKPFAVTGSLGYAMPMQNFSDGERNAQAVEWGATVQYSIPYLQQHVKDWDIPKPFANAIPVVEFAFETPTNGEDNGRTTGTINPGVIFMGHSTQLGLEAQLPLNSESGHGVGYLVQAHFYLDDLFPTTLGRPIW